MNYEEAKEVQKHNPAGVVKVLEGLEIECPKYRGSKYLNVEPMDHSLKALNGKECPQYNSTGKVKWGWQPKEGQWCIQKDGPNNYAPYLIVAIGSLVGDLFTITYGGTFLFKEKKEDYLPILEWETIQQVLLKSDYYLSIEAQANEAICRITKYEADRRWDADKGDCGGARVIVLKKGKNCQEVAMRAVCELEEELE